MTIAASLIPTISPVSGPNLLTDINLALGSFRRLVADDASGGGNVNTAQPWFPTGGGSGVLLAANTIYFFRGRLFATRSAGTTSHTTGVLFGGGASLTSIDYWADARIGDSNALAARNGLRGVANTALVIKAASTSATEDLDIWVDGAVHVNAGGTFIPQFIYSVAPGGAPTLKLGSYFQIVPANSIAPLATDDRGGLTWS